MKIRYGIECKECGHLPRIVDYTPDEDGFCKMFTDPKEIVDRLNEQDRMIQGLNMELAIHMQRLNRIKKLVYVKYGDEYIEQI